MQEEDSGDVIANEAVANVEENPAEAYSKPILTEEKLTKWGLGRGVDITKPTPWLDKTSFQVRAVCKKDLIETDEGGLLKGYSEEVNSSTTIHYQVRAGVKAPDVPLSIGVDSEYSRTDCSNKHVVGLKVKNRTISFRVDFDDLPKSRVASVKESKKQMQSDNTEVTYTPVPTATYQPTATSESKPEDTPFEIRLCGWLCECLELRGIRARGVKPQELMFLKIEKEGEDKGKRLIDSEEETRQLQEDITHFIRQLGVTHYVSAIELGGLNFRVLTEKEYERKIALSGSASLNSKLYGAIEATSSKTNIWKLKSKREERKMIGKITRNKEREIVYPKDEAVIGCQIRPISNLLRNPYLQQAVNESVRRYTQETISIGGPYIISCEGGDRKVMYLTAKSDEDGMMNVTVTFDKKDAKPFSVRTVNETLHRHELEFSLTSPLTKIKPAVPSRPIQMPLKKPTTTTHDDIVPLEYMFEVVVNPITGRGGKSPIMRLSSNYKRTRLLLKKRSNHQISCDTKDWIKGTEAYYIQCIHPLAKGFLCVKERSGFVRQRDQERGERQAPQQPEGPETNGEGTEETVEQGQGTEEPEHPDTAGTGGQEERSSRGTEGQGERGSAARKQCKIEDQYKVCVKPISFAHDTKHKNCMLFRLQPAQLNESDM